MNPWITALLLAAAKRAPAAFNYLRFTYGAAAPLYVGGTSLISQTGTHQGCPLGPAAFASGIQPVVELMETFCLTLRVLSLLRRPKLPIWKIKIVNIFAIKCLLKKYPFFKVKYIL